MNIFGLLNANNFFLDCQNMTSVCGIRSRIICGDYKSSPALDLCLMSLFSSWPQLAPRLIQLYPTTEPNGTHGIPKLDQHHLGLKTTHILTCVQFTFISLLYTPQPPPQAWYHGTRWPNSQSYFSRSSIGCEYIFLSYSAGLRKICLEETDSRVIDCDHVSAGKQND